MEVYPNIEAYYADHPDARFSVESDYGVWWRDDDGGIWRVTYVHNTGHVYAICSSGTGAVSSEVNIGGEACLFLSVGTGAGPVVILGQLDPFPEEEEERVRRENPYGVAPPDPAERALDGWAEVCGQQGSLAWVLERVRGS